MGRPKTELSNQRYPVGSAPNLVRSHLKVTVQPVVTSDRNAVKVGTSLLIVDGMDETLVRKTNISIRPTRGQARALERGLLQLSRDVYNAALQHRRDAWQIGRVSISTFDQFKEIDDELRTICPDISRFGIQPVRSAIRRVDDAMGAFFRRVKDGQTPGYPRFKTQKRFRSAFYDEPRSWQLRRLESSNPALYLQGIGEIDLSRSAANQLCRLVNRGGQSRTLTVTKLHSGVWRATVAFRGVSTLRVEPSSQVGGIDRGISVTAALPDGTLLVTPEFVKDARHLIASLQRERETYVKFSREWKLINRRIAKAYRKANHQSENWARHRANEIVERYGIIVLERLDLTAMTRSAKGTKEKPGRNIKGKRGLNRSLQEAALGRLAFWICVKAEEAGRRVWKVDPKHSSQQCVACGHTERTNRRGTSFECNRCGHRAHADVNAAQVLTCRGHHTEWLWREMGCPGTQRPMARLRRRHDDREAKATGRQYGAGSAPYAAASTSF